MKNMKRILLTIIIVYPTLAYSQQISVHSPTVANLGLYGEIPVSYFTGTPDISIPLYEIKGKQVTIPIKLNYHPAGIRPEIHPGPTGLGWSLNAGGVISRTVRGNSPDESNRNNRAGIIEGYLYYANPSGWIAQSNWKENIKNSLSNNCFACRNAAWNMAPYSDLEPDEFNFSVLDVSGKFYFDHTGKIQVQCDRPIKIIFNNEFIDPGAEGIMLDYSYSNYQIRAFKLFTIIDEHGTQYIFGGANAIEFSDPISYGQNNNSGIPGTGQLLQATSWFLTQIKSANGVDIINFEYERGPFVSQLYRSYDYYSYSGSGMSGWRHNSISKDGTLISPVYLKRIVRVNGEIIDLTYSQSNDLKYKQDEYLSIFFNQSINNYKLLNMTNAIPRFKPSPPTNIFDRIQWLKIDDISIKNANSTLLKQISFNYNNNPSERLFLESLKILGNDTQLPPVNYTFIYKNRNRLPSQYLSCITDHWGFNNGKPYLAEGFNSANKTPDSYYTDSGVLSEIIYPTGDSAKFEYELHDYSKIVNTKDRTLLNNQQGTASGVRIKKITTGNIVREFLYKENPASSLSSGILNMLPQYSYSINGNDCDGKPFNMFFTRSIPVIPLTKDNEGLFIGYTYVCERISNGSGGYIQYQFTNHDNGHADVLLVNAKWNRDIFRTDPYSSRFFERGRLKKETFYNAKGQPTAYNETIWSRYGSQGEDNPRAFYFQGLKIGYDHCSSVAYLHYCYKFLPSQKTEAIYDPIGQNLIITNTSYSYNSCNLISQIINTQSDGSVRKIVNKYPKDFQTSPYTIMVTKNILSPVVERSIFKNNSLVEKTVNDYALIYNTFYAPVNLKLQIGNNAIETREVYQYDTKNNLKEIIKDNAEKNVYLWSYSNRYPVAEIHGATYAEVESALGAATISAFAAKPNPTREEIKSFLAPLSSNAGTKGALTTCYSYKPLIGMETKTDPNGVVTKYEYDSFGRLQYIKDHNDKVIEQYDYHYKK